METFEDSLRQVRETERNRELDIILRVKQSQLIAIEDARRAREIEQSPGYGLFIDGTSPELLIRESTTVLLDFIDIMSKAGMPGSRGVMEPSTRPPERKFLRRTPPRPNLFSIRGYTIGIDKDENEIVICEDKKLRCDTGKPIRSTYIDIGKFVKKEKLDWLLCSRDWEAVPKTTTRTEFQYMTLQQILIETADRNLPRNLY